MKEKMFPSNEDEKKFALMMYSACLAERKGYGDDFISYQEYLDTNQSFLKAKYNEEIYE